MGTDDGAPDGVSPQRCVPTGHASESRQPCDGACSVNLHQVDCPVHAAAVAGWSPHTTGDGSGIWRNEAGRLRGGPRGAGGLAGNRHLTSQRLRLAGAPDLRKDVGSRVASLGVPVTWTIICGSSGCKHEATKTKIAKVLFPIFVTFVTFVTSVSYGLSTTSAARRLSLRVSSFELSYLGFASPRLIASSRDGSIPWSTRYFWTL